MSDLDAIVPEGVETTPEPCDGIDLLNEHGKKKSRATVLIEIGQKLTLFHDCHNKVYAEVPKQTHKEIWPIDSNQFKHWLQGQYYRLSNTGADRNSTHDAIATLNAVGVYSGKERAVHLRVAFHEGAIYIDVGDPAWRVIKVTGAGWEIVDQSPIAFVRKKGMRPLPVPNYAMTQIKGFTLLASQLNIESALLPLVEAFLVQSLNPAGPYPILVLLGEQGTAKTTVAKVLRAFIDPSTVPVRQPPKDERDFLVSASNNWMVCLDNLSGVPAWLSDSMCRLSTGGGYSSRELYTDSEEILIDIQRPAIVNGIDDLATRPDFAERSILLPLQPIHPSKRRDESEFNDTLKKNAPDIFGAILSSLSRAMRNVDQADFESLPRMADFTKWGYAASENGDAFLKAYNHNQQNATQVGVEASPVGRAVMALMDNQDLWTGNASGLLAELRNYVDYDTEKSKAWPKSPNWLSNSLRRLGASLRKLGIDVDQDAGAGRNITLGHNMHRGKIAQIAKLRNAKTQNTQFSGSA